LLPSVPAARAVPGRTALILQGLCHGPARAARSRAAGVYVKAGVTHAGNPVTRARRNEPKSQIAQPFRSP